MKIILCLNEDIYAAAAINLLFSCLKSHQVRIVLSSRVGLENKITGELKTLKEFEQVRLASLFADLDKREFFTNDKYKTFNQIAQIFGSKICKYQNINSAIAIKDFKEFAPDLIISIRFGQIFKNDIISIPKKGVVNLHSGILPNFRGVMPSFWSILQGENRIGTTLHYIDSYKIDAGDVINITHLEVDKNRSFIFNVNKLYDAGCKVISQFIDDISVNLKISKVEQKSLGEGRYFSYPQELQIKKFITIMPLATERDFAEIIRRW